MLNVCVVAELIVQTVMCPSGPPHRARGRESEAPTQDSYPTGNKRNGLRTKIADRDRPDPWRIDDGIAGDSPSHRKSHSPFAGPVHSDAISAGKRRALSTLSSNSCQPNAGYHRRARRQSHLLTIVTMLLPA
jgi:hypothetical protein